MRIKTLSGHLTQTNKAHINAMFEAGVMEAKVNRIHYSIKKISDNSFEVIIMQKDNELVYSGDKMRRYKSTFEVK